MIRISAQLFIMDSSKRIAFADIQGFIVNKQFVLKEISFSIAYLSSSFASEFPRYHYIFEPPFSWNFVGDTCKRGIIWSTIFQHGFYWNDGGVPYKQIDQSIEPLRQSNLIIYVMGAQKVSCMKNILNDANVDCRNIEEIGCNFRLSDCDSCRLNCGQHKHKSKLCALKSVGLLETWYYNFK